MGKFHVGDAVEIVDGVVDCKYGVTDEMQSMIGRIVHINDSREENGDGYYHIKEDYGEYIWCDRCFKFVTEDSEEIVISDDEFSGILSFLSEDTNTAKEPLVESDSQ